MENTENLVAEVTENVEQTTEQTPKTYTQEEVDAIVGKAKARTKAKIEKDYQRKYGDLEEVLKAGTGKQSVEEVTDTFKQFYQKKGIPLPQKPQYSAQDIETLAKADAEEIIRSGYDEVVEEVDRLTALGAAKMTPREKAMFKTLAEHRQSMERGNELTKLGVTEDVYNSPEFKAFASKFSSKTPITDVYDIYQKTQPKKNYQTMGSMKSGASTDSGVKDYYSPEEARKFTSEDLRKNPQIEAAILKSMPKWKR